MDILGMVLGIHGFPGHGARHAWREHDGHPAQHDARLAWHELEGVQTRSPEPLECFPKARS
eukprot:6693118-Alexandrium_andersonii.AAC.1